MDMEEEDYTNLPEEAYMDMAEEAYQAERDPVKEDYQTALDRISEAIRTQATELDLSTGISYLIDLPDELQGCTRVTSLNLSGSQLLRDIGVLATLSQLETLDLEFCSSVSIKPLAGLTRLHRLSLANTGDPSPHPSAQDISPLASMTELRHLDLGGSAPMEGWHVLAGLTKLETLSLTSHKDIYSADEVAALTNLRTLDLAGCEQLRDFGFLAGLTELRSLNLSGCTCLYSLGDLTGLVELRSLNLSYCELLADFEALRGLEALQDLQLSCCTGLVDLGVLPHLRELQHLNLSHCDEVGDFDILGGLDELRHLDLSGCRKFRDADVLASMSKLRVLRLDCCGLRSLAGIRPLLKQLQELSLEGCPLADVPSALCAQGAGNVAREAEAHFAALEQQGEATHRECKVLLLGNGRAGKTQLARHLRGLPFETEWNSTHGIQFFEFERQVRVEGEAAPQPVRLNVWDFGGQDLYHHTHRVFFQADAIYLILWNAFEPRDAELHGPGSVGEWIDRPHPLAYWLDQVFSLGGNGTPQVLIVRSKADADHGKPVPRWQDLVPATYLGAVDYVEISLRDKETHREGLAALDEWLALTVAGELGPPEHALIGQGRLAVIQELRRRQAQVTRAMERTQRSGKPADRPQREDTWLERGEFDELVQDCMARSSRAEDPAQIADYRDTTPLLQTLNRMGVLRYEASMLGNRVIIDQRWAAEGIYTLFRRQDCYQRLLAQDGTFTASQVRRWAWDAVGYSEAEQQVFLDLMVNARICFRLLTAHEAASNEDVFAAVGCLPVFAEAATRPDLARRVAETLATGGPGQCLARLEDRFLGETAVQGLLHRIGELFGRSTVLWRWGVAFQATGQRSPEGQRFSAAKIEWWERSRGSYGGELTITLHAPSPAAAMELFRRIRYEILALPGFPDTPESAWRFEEIAPASPSPAGAFLILDSFRPGPNEAASPGLQNSVGIRTPWIVGVSYAAGSEANEQTVRQLTAHLDNRSNYSHSESAYKVIEYKTDHGLRHTHEVIRELAKGDLVLVFLSEDYYVSSYCMAEFVLICQSDASDVLFLPPNVWVFGFADAQNLGKDLEQVWIKELEVFTKELMEEANGRGVTFSRLFRLRPNHPWYDYVERRKAQLAELRSFIKYINKRSTKLTDEEKSKYPGVPWEEIIALKIHQHFAASKTQLQ